MTGGAGDAGGGDFCWRLSGRPLSRGVCSGAWTMDGCPSTGARSAEAESAPLPEEAHPLHNPQYLSLSSEWKKTCLTPNHCASEITSHCHARRGPTDWDGSLEPPLRRSSAEAAPGLSTELDQLLWAAQLRTGTVLRNAPDRPPTEFGHRSDMTWSTAQR